MKVYIKSYKAGSKSVKALRDGLIAEGVDAKIIRAINSKYRHNPKKHLLVNWGNSKSNQYENTLNKPQYIENAANKIMTFNELTEHGVNTVPFFLAQQEAKDFLEAREGRVAYCRTVVQGSQGDGIIVAKEPSELVPALLYTGGITDEGRKEYRVHVFNGKVINVQEKRKRKGHKDNEDFSDSVRNLAGGWVFCTQDVELDEAAQRTCIRAVAALRLDFGAVDILQTTNGKCWVLEVNTACGLQGSTVDKYVEAIKQHIEGPVQVEVKGAAFDRAVYDEAEIDIVGGVQLPGQLYAAKAKRLG